ncbi:recombinase family protein [soil metagenome]
MEKNNSQKNSFFNTLKKKKKSKIISPRSGNVCVMYNRVSSKDQMVNGNSLDWQNEQMELHAQKNGLIVKARYGGTFESAKTDERKEFQSMLSEIKRDKTIASILVYCYDRFSRSGSNGIFLLQNLHSLGVKVTAITQELDKTTSTGQFQEGLFMLLSKLDNDMRKDKILAGTRSILRKGFWPYMTPMGYQNLNKYASADKHELVINADGKFIHTAFKMKASGKYSIEEITKILSAKGFKIKSKTLSWVFTNKFYCGFITSPLLPEELIIGKHPKLISEELFINANNIQHSNPRAGIPKFQKNDELPLKVFVKDDNSSSPFTGYINKKKKLAYYKSRDKGTAVNVSAKSLNALFRDLINDYKYDKQFRSQLRNALHHLLEGKISEQIVDEKQNKKRIKELRNSINKLEERFVLDEINKEQFEKFSKKFQAEIAILEKESADTSGISSNLEIALDKGLEIAENIGDLWENSSFEAKQKLQYLVFPEGVTYNKENGKVRTTKVNSLFAAIPLLSSRLSEQREDKLKKNLALASNVENSGFEPLTSCMPCKRSTN